MQEFSDEWVAKLNEIANRWVKGFGPMSGYNRAGNIWIEPVGNVLRFSAMPVESGIGWVCRIPNFNKYLEDDSTVEADGKKFYDDYMNERHRMFTRMREIEESELFKEYKDLQSKAWGNYGFNL